MKILVATAWLSRSSGSRLHKSASGRDAGCGIQSAILWDKEEKRKGEIFNNIIFNNGSCYSVETGRQTESLVMNLTRTTTD